MSHPDPVSEFPPRRLSEAIVAGRVPVWLTSFVGHRTELADVQRLLDEHRLVTLAGVGGVGKTRLAVRLAPLLADAFSGEVWFVDLAPIADPNLVAVRVARTLGLPDQPGRTTIDTVVWFIADRPMLIVLDNCERLVGACAGLVATLLTACAGLKIMATSREPIGVPGEVTRHLLPLPVADEAVELFVTRARLAQLDFSLTDDTAAVVGEICRRLDGVALAIELAAARVRTLSLDEIGAGIGDLFRLLTGGSRTAPARQRTPRACMDWSYDLLDESERVLFGRLAVFRGGFDLDAAQAVGGGVVLARHRARDGLSLLVDKSLVLIDDNGHPTRYRLLDTMRCYALDKLAASGEAEMIHTRHRDHYLTVAACCDASMLEDFQRCIERVEIELDNFRAAFAWSRFHGDAELALRLASSLLPLWQRGRVIEGLGWFDSALAEGAAVAPAVRAQALADKTLLEVLAGNYGCLDHIEPALAIARELDDPKLLARVLTARAATCTYSNEAAGPYFEEAIELARALGDDRQLSWLLGCQAISICWTSGDPLAARTAAEEGY